MFIQHIQNIRVVTFNAPFSCHTTIAFSSLNTFYALRSYRTDSPSYTLITFCTIRSTNDFSALNTLFTFRSYWTDRSARALFTFLTTRANITFYPCTLASSTSHFGPGGPTPPLSPLTPAPPDGPISPRTPFGHVNLWVQLHP